VWLTRRHRELTHHFRAHATADLGTEHALLSLAEHGELTRHLATIHALVVIAPLLGLLGTVTGIIATFDALLRGAAVDGLGSGVAAALVTTQFGIAVAVPGVIGERVVRRRVARLMAGQRHAVAEVGSQRLEPAR
jgi:biopolymer transport protein ExbB